MKNRPRRAWCNECEKVVFGILDHREQVHGAHIRKYNSSSYRAKKLSKEFKQHMRVWNSILGAEDKIECWNWLGAKTKDGYSIAMIRRKIVLVHRYMYEYYFGAIPEGLVIDHLCRNRLCVNPYHLEVVTRELNTRRYYADAAYERLINELPNMPLCELTRFACVLQMLINAKQCVH